MCVDRGNFGLLWTCLVVFGFVMASGIRLMDMQRSRLFSLTLRPFRSINCRSYSGVMLVQEWLWYREITAFIDSGARHMDLQIS